MLDTAVGTGPGASVPLFTQGVPDPRRNEVEEWLREKELEAETLSTRRHNEQLDAAREGARWARWAFWAAVASVAATLLIALLGK